MRPTDPAVSPPPRPDGSGPDQQASTGRRRCPVGRFLTGRGPFEGIPGAPTAVRRLGAWAVVAVALAIYWWSARGAQFDLPHLMTGLPRIGNLLVRMGPFEPVTVAGVTRWEFSHRLLMQQLRFVQQTWGPLAETLRIAVVATTAGALLAVPFSLLGARNLAPFRWLYWLVRGFLNLVRTLPDIVLAAVFAGAFGVGVLPGILAMTVFAFAIVSKLTSESVEAIDPGPLEALRASGANRLQTIAFAVLPQVLPQFTAYTLYVFEIEIRTSFVLGLVGAGGIGHILQNYLDLLNYRAVAIVILVMFAVVLLVDRVSTHLRERLL